MAWDLLREMRGDSHLERGRSLVRFNQEPCWSGLQQGQAFGAAEQRAVGHEEFSAWELPALFSSVGKILTARIQHFGQGTCDAG